jgi:gliding motility-associated-like protein
MKAVVYNDDQVKYKQYTYFWEIDGDIEGTNSTASHTFDSIGTYNASLIITTVKGCKDTTTKTIELFQKINVPNVITPNGDGYNDNLVIENNDKYYLNLQLFNRAGLLVYKIKAKTIQWDGKLHTGEDVPEGIYYYILEAEKSSPPLKMKGFLYIFR